MKKDRDMFYSDYQCGSFNNPNMGMQPQGYMMNQQYQAFGPNMIPNNYNNNYNNSMYNMDIIDELESRVSKLETQIRRIDNRISKLESFSSTESVNISNDSYMI